MTLFQCVLTIAVMAVLFMILFIVQNRQRLIWESRGKVFSIRQTGNHRWVIEKRFLCFYVNCSEILGFHYFDTEEEAIVILSTNMRGRKQNHDITQNYKQYIIDFSKQITDPKWLIESKKNRY